VLSVASILVYTRLYIDEDFGLWGIFMALVMIGKTIACGGFHVCLMLPKEESTARDLLSISYWFNWLTIIISIVAVCALIHFFPQSVSESQHLLFIFGVPLSIFLEGKSQAIHNWLNRDMRYKEMSWTTVTQTLTTVFFSILLGWVNTDYNGMVLGTLIGQFAMLATLLYFSKLPFFIRPALDKMKVAFKEYRSFFTLGVTGNLINNSASQLPFIFFGVTFGEGLNGQFSTAQQKILSAPVNLVSAAVSPVFFKESNKAHLAQDGSLKKLVNQLNLVMWAMIIVPVIVVMMWGPEIFAFVLGEEWVRAGMYAQWLAPLMGVRFVTHPMSYLLDVKQRLSAQLAFNILLLCATLIIFHPPILGLDDFTTIKVFGVSFFSLQLMFLMYLFHLRKDDA